MKIKTIKLEVVSKLGLFTKEKVKRMERIEVLATLVFLKIWKFATRSDHSNLSDRRKLSKAVFVGIKKSGSALQKDCLCFNSPGNS